ncbi:hypothetical protein ACJU26_05585 [Acidithiobacillus sp. M4-SHS-6]|uniref:ATP-grasp domain-containing protein n=1 Tax=Acidithiobacillus sp. M4-SHS-6 TaxID=3383024 RepID=UPI0039BE5FBC
MSVTVYSFSNYFSNPEVEFVANQVCHERRVTHVVALREFDLLRAARVRQVARIAGMPLENVEIFRDKLLMKLCARSHGINTPRFKAIDNARDLWLATFEFGYPFVVKPRRKAGGMGFMVLNTGDDLAALWELLTDIVDIDSPLDLIAEEFFGKRNMYHLDGVWDGTGFQYFFANEYVGLRQHYPEFRQGIDPYPVCGSINLPSQDNQWEALHDFARQVIQALGEGNKVPHAFHIEVWEYDGQLSLNEAACRPGGGQVFELQTAVMGVTPDVLYLRTLRGQIEADMQPSTSRYTLLARIPRKAGILKSVPESLAPYVREIKLFYTSGDTVPPQSSWLDRMGYVVCEASERSVVEAAALEANVAIHACIVDRGEDEHL